MKHKHKWQISHINNLFPQFIQDNILNIAKFEYAYIICDECGEVRKKKVKESKKISNEELLNELKKEAYCLRRKGLPYLAKTFDLCSKFLSIKQNGKEELDINVPREASPIPYETTTLKDFENICSGTTAGDDPYQTGGKITQRIIYHTKR